MTDKRKKMYPTKVSIVVTDSLTEGQTIIFFTNDNITLHMFSETDTKQYHDQYFKNTQDVEIQYDDIPQLFNENNDYNAYSVRFVTDENEKDTLVNKIRDYDHVKGHPKHARIYDSNFYYSESDEEPILWREYLQQAQLTLPKIKHR